MYNDIHENVALGSNTVYLDIPREEFELAYGSVSRANAQDLVSNYFHQKGKDGIPEVTDTAIDRNTNRVRVVVHVEHGGNKKIHEYIVPDSLNINRDNQ